VLAAGRLPEKDTASGQGLPRPQGLFDGSGGDVGCAWQVDNFTVVAEEVETSGPIITHNKNVYTVRLDIRDFLLPALLRNNLIHIADCLQDGCTPAVRMEALLVLAGVEFVGRESHGQMVAQLAGASQQVDVPVMEQIKGPVGDDFGHKRLQPARGPG